MLKKRRNWKRRKVFNTTNTTKLSCAVLFYIHIHTSVMFPLSRGEALHFIFGFEKCEAWDFTGTPPANMKNRSKYTGINISINKSIYNNIFDQIFKKSQVKISLKREETKIISINGWEVFYSGHLFRMFGNKWCDCEMIVIYRFTLDVTTLNISYTFKLTFFSIIFSSFLLSSLVHIFFFIHFHSDHLFSFSLSHFFLISI